MSRTDTAAGAAVYHPLLLRYLYDFIVLAIYFPYGWRTPTSQLRAFYSRLVAQAGERAGGNDGKCQLMDVGVGTGYFLAHAPLPTNAQMTLADLNPACLESSGARTAEAHPSVTVRKLQADFLDRSGPLALTPGRVGGEAKFDLISCMLLLHCLPGPPERKAEALVNLKPLLKPDGVLCGATVLGKGVRYGLLGTFLMWCQNRSRIFDNKADSAAAIVTTLQNSFEEVKWEVVGMTLLFEARN